MARPRRPRLAVALATNQLPPAPTIDAAVKPSRSPVLGDTFAGARRPSKQVGEEIGGERETSGRERAEERERKKEKEERERADVGVYI